jgi:hypothetical protein
VRRIAPYPVLADEVTLTVHEVRLDDVPLPYESTVSERDRRIALHLVGKDWSTVRLVLRAAAPRHELEAGPWKKAAFVATASERRTNVHTAVKLDWGGPAEWVGEVELHRDDHVDRVLISGHLVATVDDVEGRVIADVARPWTVDLQANSPTPRDEIAVRWADFAKVPQLKRHEESPWTVSVTDEAPILYLNSGFEGLRAVLTGTKASDRPARELLASQIAVSLWTTLFNEAIRHVEGTDWPDGWRGMALRRMLPDVFPERSPDDALREVGRGTTAPDLPTRVLHAAIKQAKAPRSLANFIRSLQKTGSEDR